MPLPKLEIAMGRENQPCDNGGYYGHNDVCMEPPGCHDMPGLHPVWHGAAVGWVCEKDVPTDTNEPPAPKATIGTVTTPKSDGSSGVWIAIGVLAVATVVGVAIYR
jgi:hypothetical protein